MLKVFIHNGPKETINTFNALGRLDIAYEELDMYADYKAVLLMNGIGEIPPAILKGYPRWTDSIWDLVMRMICMCVHREESLPIIEYTRNGAFAKHLSVLIQHWPDGRSTGRTNIGSAQIQMTRRRRHYIATFEDDILGKKTSSVFSHTPGGLNPWDLLARAYAWMTHESMTMPPRLKLQIPKTLTVGEKVFVSLESVNEPAKTGLMRWMISKQMEPVIAAGTDQPCVTEETFVKFLRRAV